MAQCITCGKTLSNDEIGLHKKLVNRGVIGKITEI